MKSVSIMFVSILFLGATNVRAELTAAQVQEQCRSDVNTYLQSIKAIKEGTGEETKPLGLSAKDVEELRAKDGDCETAKIIRKGMWLKKS